MEIEKAIEELEEVKDVLWGNLTAPVISLKKTGIAIEVVLKELEKKDNIIEFVKDRIEYYLTGNSKLDDFYVREKELKRLLKILNKANEEDE